MAAVSLTKRIAKDGIVEDWGGGTIRLVPGDTQEVGEPEPEPEPEPEQNDDTTPTETAIAIVFAEHDGDEGEAQQ